MYNAMAVVIFIFIDLYKNRHNLILGYFDHSKKESLCPLIVNPHLLLIALGDH